jgi:hypothetical protein
LNSAWNKVARAKQVKEFLTRKPASAAHKLIFHEGDMCRWATESRCSQTQKEQSEFTY